MKKFFAVLLALAMVLALTACGGGSGSATQTPATQAPATNPPADPTDPPAEPTDPPAEPGEAKTIVIADYIPQDVWEDDGGEVKVEADQIHFDNGYAGDYAALRLKETADNATWKFNLQLTSIPEGLSEDAGDWWDAELCIIVRSALAGSGYADGEQTGYTVTCWGDMSTVYLGRSGYDDAFGSFAWPCGDGQPHDVEITAENNADKTAVTIKLVVDGTLIAEVTDDGSLVKEGRTPLFPEPGGWTMRCKYVEATVK